MKETGLKPAPLEKKIGLGNGAIQKAISRGSNLTLDTMKKIETAYPNINPAFLKEGAMPVFVGKGKKAKITAPRVHEGMKFHKAAMISEVGISGLSERLHIPRSTLYLYFNRETLPATFKQSAAALIGLSVDQILSIPTPQKAA